jgi:epoxyqueuosine reductase
LTDPESIVSTLRQSATELGLQWCGIAPAVESTGFSDLVRWIEAGYAGQMSYIPDRIEAYRHPDAVLSGVRSIIVLALPYNAAPSLPRATTADTSPAQRERSDAEAAGRGASACGDHNTTGRIARYAHSGIDYHDTIHLKLKQLRNQISDLAPGSKSRGIVDTAPLMEREVAQLSGFGWRGKNTLLLNKRIGSYFFLACMLTDVDLPIDVPHEATHCGTCTACLDACPTDAFPQPGVLDATRCISYLTIEHRGPIDIALRKGIGDWLFGCDVCQEVCPWNDKPGRSAEAEANAMVQLELGALFDLTEDQFRARFRKTPLWRTRRRGILRNAAIVIGNAKQLRDVSALIKGLGDSEPIVRGASAWALGQINAETAKEILRQRLQIETDETVIEEINQAISV